MGRLGPCPHGVPAFHDAAGQDIAGLVRMDCRCTVGECGLDAVEGRQRLPGDWKVRRLHRLDSFARPHQGQNGLAAVAHEPFREDRLVLEIGIDAERIFARHITGRKNARDTRIAGNKWRQVADGETRVRVGRADRPQPKGIGWGAVVAENGRTGEPGRSIDAQHAVSNRGAGLQRWCQFRHFWRLRTNRCRIENRIHDLEVAGAAAQHAAPAHP